jgi:hypothetical protein
MCDTHTYTDTHTDTHIDTYTYRHRLLHPLKRDTEVVAVVSKNGGLVEVDKHHHLVDALACPILSHFKSILASSK